MNLPAKLRSTSAKRLSLLGSILLAGCANPGPPRPPSLHLPKPVVDLTAERIGDEVKLHWTTPTKTTDDLPPKGVITAEVCRSISTAAHCSLTRRITVHPGPSEATDLLPSDLVAEPQQLIRYQITLLNDQERSAGLSAPAFAAAGSAPPIVTHLQVRTTAQGALLQWESKDAADAIELIRLHIDAPSTSASTKRASAKAAKEPAEMHLRASKPNFTDNPFVHDAGGTLDATARRGETYSYTAQRLRSVVIAGHTLELRSNSSPAVDLAMRDIFPPRPPAGLEAIANPSSTAASIDLSWQPNTEPDLAGYRVYRQDGSTAAVNLTPELIPIPGFRDVTAIVGHRYLYSVTAVDSAGNESQRTLTVSEELRQP